MIMQSMMFLHDHLLIYEISMIRTLALRHGKHDYTDDKMC